MGMIGLSEFSEAKAIEILQEQGGTQVGEVPVLWEEEGGIGEAMALAVLVLWAGMESAAGQRVGEGSDSVQSVCVGGENV